MGIRRTSNSKPSISSILGTSFEADSRLSLGATQSGHGVIFGRLEGEQVAAKPFYGDRSETKANYEARMTKEIASAGFFTLDMIGVIPNKDGTAAVLLSRYKQGFIGCNGLSLESDPGTQVGSRVGKAVTSIVFSLADLHSQNFTHGDPHTRNFGFRQGGFAQQEPLLFDLEKATAHTCGSEYLAGAVKNEMTKLAYSLGRRRYGGPDFDTAVANFCNTVTIPYAETFVELGAPPPLIPVVNAAIEVFTTTYQKQSHLTTLN